MNILVDTHIFIWALEDNHLLTSEQRYRLKDFQHNIFISQVSIMELAIKLKIGKLPQFIVNLEDLLQQWLNDGFEFLPLQNKHIFAYTSLPIFDQHRDPFDRFILATALAENMAVMSSDEKFLLYKDIITII